MQVTPIADKIAAKLTSSGLQGFSLEQLCMESYTHDQTAAVHPCFHPLPTLVINYMDPWSPGEKLRHRPKWPPFRRFRYLENPPPGRDGKVQRYIQPPDMGVCAYFSTLLDWRPIFDSPADIFITEGELKAAKACAMGFPTIGLGGVSNIFSRKTGVGFLPELERIDWVQRRVYICFDNDGAPNPDVLLAINRLGEELFCRGAVPHLILLPSPNGTKVGLDDYFLDHDAQDFITLINAAESLTLAEPLWSFNERFVRIADPDVVVELDTGRMLKAAAWEKFHTNVRVPEQVVQRNGSMSYKPVSASERWSEWPMRRQVTGITYAPAQPQFLDNTYNTWKGWGAPAKKGDVTPFLELLQIIFGPTKEGLLAKRWFLQWLAYPIQHPGAKLYTAVLLWSTQHGTGKTLLGYVMRNVYGIDNSIQIDQGHLHSQFNSWARGKQFILADDITGSDKREVADRLKSFVTQSHVLINEKHLPTFELPNVANVMLTSNNASALYLEDDDRRYFVWEVQGKGTDEFYARFDHWYKNRDGSPNLDAAGAIRHYLEQVELKDFNPNAKALLTHAKQLMVESGRSSAAEWCHKLAETPDVVMRCGSAPIHGDMATSERLWKLFKGTPEGQGSTIAPARFASELKAAGVPQWPQVVRFGSPQRKGRFFIFRNAETWLKAKEAQLRKHIETSQCY